MKAGEQKWVGKSIAGVGEKKTDAPGGNRTRDLWFIRPVLYLLSYSRLD